MKLSKGWTYIWASLILTFFLWLLSKESLSEILIKPLISINQISALLGTILFAWSMALSTRISFIENLFNGLDKVYKAHSKVSKWGFVLILIHPLSLAISNLNRAVEYFLPFHKDIAINFGVYSFWIFVYLILITLFIKEIGLKYDKWRILHKIINLSMVLVLLHILKVKSDTSIFFPLGLWMNLVTILGIASGIYKLFFYEYFSPRFKYRVTYIKKLGEDMYDILLKPIGKKIDYLPGQYAYVKFISDKVGTESHPFCIASNPKDDSLRLVIKELGDFTKTIKSLTTNDHAILYGPHGRISKRYYQNDTLDAVFIGGGIGIAPFLAMFRSELKKLSRNTTLYYCTKYKKEAVFDEELYRIANSKNKLYYHNQCSRDGDGHLDIEKLYKSLKNPKHTVFYLCSTSLMMTSIEKQLQKLGVKSESIVKEDFDMF